VEPEFIVDYHCVTGEGPLWHPDEQKLYWLDIPLGRLFRYDPATKTSQIALEVPYQIGGYTVQADGSLCLLGSYGLVQIWREGKPLETVAEIPAEKETRFNDVIADPVGRIYGGTMRVGPDKPGRFYRIELDGSTTMMYEGVACPNGMGFTPDLKHMYYTETFDQKISLFDWDEKTGDLTHQRTFVEVARNDTEGHPDGMTVDAEGYVWSARWDGHCVVRYSPDGKEVSRITLPTAKKVSCPTFAGPDYGDLYLTTAGGHEKAENGPDAGSLFKVRTGVKGVPEFRSRIKL
jgi:D-xylono/L-arabinono-1,4-lactonase